MTEETEVEGGVAVPDLAAKIAREIFRHGDNEQNLGGVAQRIQYMGGTWPGNEKPMGGLIEGALAQVIRKALLYHGPAGSAPSVAEGTHRPV